MNLGFPEMMFIFILALILFGPKKLPEIGRQIGKGLAEFKRASREFQSQIEDEVRKLEVEADLKNVIAPISFPDIVSAEPPALTIGTPVGTPAESSHPDLPPASTSASAPASASSNEIAAAATDADYDTDAHSASASASSLSSSSSANPSLASASASPSSSVPTSLSSSASTPSPSSLSRADSAGNA